MARYIVTITLHVDTQGDSAYAAKTIAQDVTDWGKTWLGVTAASYTLEEDNEQADLHPTPPVPPATPS